MKLTKLTSWFSDEEPDKTPSSTPSEPSEHPELLKLKSQVARLSEDLQISQKELAQTKAQLQINQGFQIELGQTQLQLNLIKAELEQSEKDLFEQQRSFQATRSQLQVLQKDLAKYRDWLHQVKTSIQIVDIKKTLLKQDFETLWGFGIISPQVETNIVHGALVVKGWVLGKKSPARKVIVKYQGQNLLEAPVKLRRPLVIQQYPDISNADTSGFEFAVSVAGIPEQIVLSLETILEDETTVPLCDFILAPPSNESNDT